MKISWKYKYPEGSTGHWGSSGISSWTPPLLHIHNVTGTHHTGTWLLLPLLCWWHTALSFISTRSSNISCTDIGLAWRTSWHGWKNITYSSTWQRLSFLSSLPLQLYSMISHRPVRFVNKYPIKFSQKSWCNLWWSADFQRPHCKNCSILQVCTTQQQKDQALPNVAYFLSRPLSFLGWTIAMLFWLDFHHAQKGTHHTSLYLHALATGFGSHQVQDIDACI